MPQGDRLDQIFVQRQGSPDGPRDLTHFEGVRHAGSIVVALRINKNLGLVFQAAERLGMQDSVTIALESGADRIWLFGADPALALAGTHGVPRQRFIFSPLNLGPKIRFDHVLIPIRTLTDEGQSPHPIISMQYTVGMSTRVRDVYDAIDRIAPWRMALDGDRVGLNVGDMDAPVEHGLLTFDSSLASIAAARQCQAQLIVAHHPVLWAPLKTLTTDSYNEKRVLELVRGNLSLLAAHTNWDACPGGLNDWLAGALDLQEVEAFGSSTPVDLYKLVVFVPSGNREVVFKAVCGAGAGQIGEYKDAGFWGPGIGTFLPTGAAKPAIGQVGKREEVMEDRLEVIVEGHNRSAVESALHSTHPYEVPAYEFYAVGTDAGQGIGRIGNLPRPMNLLEFRAHLDTHLSTRTMLWGDAKTPIQRIAVVGGAADDEWQAAQALGAQALVSGEVKQHVALEAAESGFVMAAAGHYATEHPSMQVLLEKLLTEVPGVKWDLFTPDPGQSGRPL